MIRRALPRSREATGTVARVVPVAPARTISAPTRETVEIASAKVGEGAALTKARLRVRA